MCGQVCQSVRKGIGYEVLSTCVWIRVPRCAERYRAMKYKYGALVCGQVLCRGALKGIGL